MAAVAGAVYIVREEKAPSGVDNRMGLTWKILLGAEARYMSLCNGAFCKRSDQGGSSFT